MMSCPTGPSLPCTCCLQYQLVEETRERLKGQKASVIGYGHLGDSNLHLNVSVGKCGSVWMTGAWGTAEAFLDLILSVSVGKCGSLWGLWCLTLPCTEAFPGSHLTVQGVQQEQQCNRQAASYNSKGSSLDQPPSGHRLWLRQLLLCKTRPLDNSSWTEHFISVTSCTGTPNEEVQKLIEPFVYEWTAKRMGSISAEHGLGQMKAEYIG